MGPHLPGVTMNLQLAEMPECIFDAALHSISVCPST